MGYLRRNLLVPVPEMTSLEAYNGELLARCDGDHRRAHYRSEKTIAELFTADEAALLPLPQIPFDPARYETLRADAYAMVSLERGLHRYSSSPRYARELVRVRIDAHRVTVLDESLREIDSHSRLYGAQKQQRVQWLPHLCQLSRRPRALKYSGCVGDDARAAATVTLTSGTHLGGRRVETARRAHRALVLRCRLCRGVCRPLARGSRWRWQPAFRSW